MNLEVASGRIFEMASENDILTSLEGEEYAILGPNPNSYIQCAERKAPPYDYVLEYQDGSTAKHFLAVDGPISMERVQAAFVKYLRGDASWRFDFEWEKLKL